MLLCPTSWSVADWFVHTKALYSGNRPFFLALTHHYEVNVDFTETKEGEDRAFVFHGSYL